MTVVRSPTPSLPRLVAVYPGTEKSKSHLMDSGSLVVGNARTLCGEGVPGDWTLDLRLGRDVDCGACVRAAESIPKMPL